MLKHIKKNSLSIALISSLAFFAGCSDIENDGANIIESGETQLVSGVVVEDINASTMLPFAQAVAASKGETTDVSFGYKSVKITYNTKGQNDEDIVASGLLIIPTATDAYQASRVANGEDPYTVSMINDNHGTIFTNADAPSSSIVLMDDPTAMTAEEQLYATMVSYAGFAAIIPDYIGYGESNDEAHPYMLKKASARASLDMIKASMKYMNDNGIAINYQLYISGYSQGGYTTMALAEEIETNGFSENVTLMGVAPMAAPSSLTDLADIELVDAHTMEYPAFLAYLADSYSYFYDDINLSEAVLYPDADTFHSFFDGSKSNVEIHVNLGLTDYPADPLTDYGFKSHTANELFKTDFMSDYQENANNTLRVNLEANNVDDWTPKTPMNLIHCVDDEIIPFSMSQNVYSTFTDNDVNVTLSPIPTAYLSQQQDALNPFIHANCAKEAYGVAITWFDSIRTPQEED